MKEARAASGIGERGARLAAAGWLALAAATAMSFYWGVLRAPTLEARPDNPRRLAADRATRRGRILDRAGRELAVTDFDPSGSPTRRYPFPAAAPVVGYQTWRYGAGAQLGASYGAGGAEAAYDGALRGAIGLSPSDLLASRVLGRAQQGHDIVLTLDAQLQQEAYELLAATGHEGAVVVIDVDDGALRALVSHPTFDAAALDRGEIADDDPERRLLNRATQGLYPPGSTWKAVTLGAALDQGLTRLDLVVQDGDAVDFFDGFAVRCDNNPPGLVSFDIAHAFAYSCNLSFARMGEALGEAGMRRYAEAAGIERAVPFRLPTVAGQLDGDGHMPPAEIASAAFGQGELLVTPLHMAVYAAAVAADGRLRRPWLLRDVPDLKDLRWRSLADRQGTWGRALPSRTAAKVREAMIISARDGWAASARVGRAPGFDLGAKTGTAELDQGEPHSWTIAFAPADRPIVAAAVLVVGGGQGADVAAPIAGAVLEKALSTGR